MSTSNSPHDTAPADQEVDARADTVESRRARAPASLQERLARPAPTVWLSAGCGRYKRI